ncbi:MAG: peptidoglycan-binding protein [Rhodobacteraceae bacterium PARR1]|nr:MAG: peptidoglycan-binding protein [Rhodobacteraceae bacterium PARR1]
MKFAALRLCVVPVTALSVYLSASALLVIASPVAAQTAQPGDAVAATAWVQIEAQPDLSVAQERAAAWAAVFPDVQGYALGSGWYAIALGPYDGLTAETRRRLLRDENLIPRDSFLADGTDFGPMFWPSAGAAPALAPAVEPAPLAEITTAPLDAPTPTAPALPDESPDEARASESLLTQTEREDLQTALQWFGFYNSTIDGAFGRGTRASMAAWQEAQGLDPTGILTTAQRATLTTAWRDETRAFGFETLTEDEAGIELTIPAALVEFDHYEPPFVHFRAKDGSNLRLVLISTPGSGATLSGLYDTLQTLEIMPPDGPRALAEDGFSLQGANADVVTVAEATAKRGLVKGWMLSYAPADAPRMERVLQTIRGSFRGVGDRALDPGMVPLDDSARQGLLAGLEVRHARLSRSGFYVDAAGAVLTTTEAVAQCGRILLDGVTEATVALSDAATGLAVLKPSSRLAPASFANLAPTAPAPGTELAVAGYSYEDRLSAPVLTFGQMAEAGGLNGEAGINRLAITTLPGDAGGPVVARNGSVVGILLPATGDIARVLTSAGVTATTATASGDLTPEALTKAATGMTVLVSCFD